MSATAPPKLPRGAALRVSEAVAIGTVLDGKYRVESELGRGGMAVVFAARHVTLGHAVAIKVLRPGADRSPEQAQRVVREARAAAGLASENATRVFDVGALDSGEPYMVMERLVGVDLARLALDRGPLPVEEVAGYLVQACDAIMEAHARGIVHRDLKPSNLFLTTRRDGTALVKLMDFGISKVVSSAADEDALTGTHDSLGTPHYMSPEQLFRAREVDARADVWALGVILYRLLTAEHAFAGETTPAVHVAVASAPAPRLRDRRPDAPAELEQLVLDCLVKSRDARLPSVKTFARALLPYADPETRARYAHLGGDPSTESDPVAAVDIQELGSADGETRDAWGTAATRTTARVRWTLVALGGGGLAVAAVLGFGSLRAEPRATSSPTSSAISSGATAAGVVDSASAPAAAATTGTAAGEVASAPPPPSAPSTAGAASLGSAPRPVRSPPSRSLSPRLAAPPPRSDPYGQRR
jgi:serine/threonine-protein kinase